MTEDQGVDSKGPEECPPAMQQPLALMDFSLSGQEGRLAAQKCSLVDDVPNSI